MQELFVYNTLTRKKEKFQPLHSPFVGMYVCGPTVYSDAHLGHAKSYVSFDVIYRYLMHISYKVRYVQNITDVGHLTDNADSGEDKLVKRAVLEKLQPMELAEKYILSYWRDMDALNNLRPNICPRASGHIPEQIEMVQELVKKGFAYDVKGTVYFDVKKYSEKNNYGKLSGRKIDELITESRELKGQEQKRSPLDFALWKSAPREHILNWKSPWGEGYPGWHIECSAMSMKYLGDSFDIHGGGLENQFPHHECEIAQSEGSTGKPFVKYWIHNNMVTLNRQKMGKSLGNSVYLHELFSGQNKLLKKAYSPMTVRFLILQSHYRSTLDFSDEGLLAAEKGLKRLMDGYNKIKSKAEKKGNGVTENKKVSENVKKISEQCYEAMNDDFNTSQVIAHLFDGISRLTDGQALAEENPDSSGLKKIYDTFLFDILGLKTEEEKYNKEREAALIDTIIELREEARNRKDFHWTDKLRNRLKEIGVALNDTKDGTTWTYEK